MRESKESPRFQRTASVFSSATPTAYRRKPQNAQSDSRRERGRFGKNPRLRDGDRRKQSFRHGVIAGRVREIRKIERRDDIGVFMRVKGDLTPGRRRKHPIVISVLSVRAVHILQREAEGDRRFFRNRFRDAGEGNIRQPIIIRAVRIVLPFVSARCTCRSVCNRRGNCRFRVGISRKYPRLRIPWRRWA